MAKASTGGAGLWDYLKEAFLFRWNLLFFLGAAAAAAISPIPEVALPLIGAAEIAYLASMSATPKFRSAIDAKAHAAGGASITAQQAGTVPQQTVEALVAGLSVDARARFENLRQRCREMRSIAKGVGGRAGKRRRADDLSGPGLDRLLWVFLRLLYSKTSLRKFLAATDSEQIRQRLESVRQKLETARAGDDQRLIRSLTDSLATQELRLDNHQKAERNAEFVAIELDRLEGKIQTLSEMAVNRQDPDFISREVDSVAESMHHTEAAISELSLVDGLIEDLAEPPPILEADLGEVMDK